MSQIEAKIVKWKLLRDLKYVLLILGAAVSTSSNNVTAATSNITPVNTVVTVTTSK